MSRLNQWSFRGVPLNQVGARVTDLTGPFALPPLRGDNFLTYGRTGQLFVPKLHDERRISLEITAYEDGVRGTGAQWFFDQLATLFANRAQGALQYTNIAGYTRTGQAECVGWTPKDVSNVGLVFKGIADFLLADPWLYGATVTGSVTPNAGLAFGTPVISNISGPRTTWAAALSGVTSGQPIIVAHAAQGYTTALSSIADTFGGHYTWTQVDIAHTYIDCELYIGTGGTGTSGTVTITAPSGLIGGFVMPMIGASVGVGLAAVDVHGHNSGTFPPTYTTLSLTPSASWEGALVWGVGVAPSDPLYPFAQVLYLGGNSASAGAYLYPTSGTPLVMTAPGYGNTGGWDVTGAILKTSSGAAVTLNLTNPGTALAEKLTLDFLGPIVNPTMTNTTNGTSVTINVTVSGTKHLIVDTGAFTALNDGTSVIGSVTHSGAAPFLTLNPGVNALQISGAACTGSTLVTVSFAPPYE